VLKEAHSPATPEQSRLANVPQLDVGDGQQDNQHEERRSESRPGTEARTDVSDRLGSFGLSDLASEPVNMMHMELCRQFLWESDVLALGFGEAAAGQRRYMLFVGMTSPFLMNEILAIAARQLAAQGPPERRELYRQQASILQTHALNLFTAPGPQIPNRQNAEAIFLFSSFLGIHLLSETLEHRDGDLDVFLTRFLKYGQLHRGVKSVAQQCWAHLDKDSEIFSIIAGGTALIRARGKGSECRDLKSLILDASDLPFATAQACYSAVGKLQWALDEPEPGDLKGHREKISFTWPLLVDDEYIDMLEQRQPIGLVILAYYGAVLHRFHSVWVVGDAGKFLVRLVTEYLGSEWAQHLQWPNSYVNNE
jgi:hypothetical protein